MLGRMTMKTVPDIAARIVSYSNVEDEAVRAFCQSLLVDESVDEYLKTRHIRFVSTQVESTFLSHLLALSEYTLARGHS